MRRRVADGLRGIVFLGIALATSCLYAAGPPGEVQEVRVQPTSRVPVLDGKLDDLAWRGAAVHGSSFVAGLHYTGSRTATVMPVVLLAYDRLSLYVAARSYTPDPSGLKATSTDGQFHWGDDLIQIFLEPFLDGRSVFYGVNAAGVTSEPGIRVGIARDAVSWTAELAIPWAKCAVKPDPGSRIGFNFVANQTTTGDGWISWAVLYGSAQNPERFGYLLLGEPRPVPSIPTTPEEDDF